MIVLISPSGTTINLLNIKGGNSNDIMTVFSDAADSAASFGFTLLPSFGISPSFSPSVKPDNSLSIFNGQSRNGFWKLKCVDQAGADIGYVHGWGINMLSYKTLNVTALIQGFYDTSTDKMKSDTARMYFRIPLPPYPLVDSSKAVLDSNGNAVFYFNKINNGYRVFRHRNSIETWSSAPVPFIGDSSSYNYTDASSKAYGNNMIQVDSTPVKFAVYSGDVNQNGAVDLDDVIQVYNDANVFALGYVVTDVTGNNLTDLNDVLLTYNNSNMFVSVMKP